MLRVDLRARAHKVGLGADRPAPRRRSATAPRRSPPKPHCHLLPGLRAAAPGAPPNQRRGLTQFSGAHITHNPELGKTCGITTCGLKFCYIQRYSKKKILSQTAPFSSKQFELESLPHILTFYIGVNSRGQRLIHPTYFWSTLLHDSGLSAGSISNIPNLQVQKRG